MHIVLLILIVLALVFGPGLWVRQVMSKYSKPVDRYRGSGGQLARYLLDNLNLNDVQVEVTEQGDHYDPESRTVRLSEKNFNDRSLTAVTIAAHEVGHAIQHHQNYPPLMWRSRLV